MIGRELRQGKDQLPINTKGPILPEKPTLLSSPCVSPRKLRLFGPSKVLRLGAGIRLPARKMSWTGSLFRSNGSSRLGLPLKPVHAISAGFKSMSAV